MKPHRIITLFCFILSCCPLAHAQDMDTAITKLTEDIAAKIKENGNKKITVLDFTDLEGNATELGRYVAEQVTVDFVMTKRDFAVLDRANLKKILDEHKLTSTGLVDPENAKQLGKFAGVDAMIFGTLVPVGENVNVAVKVITTESAEVVGGAKAKFKLDESVKKLMGQSAKAEEAKVVAEKPVLPPSAKPFGDLEARITTLRLNRGDNYYGSISFTAIITNTSATDSYGIALKGQQDKISLSNSRGEEFEIIDLRGIGPLVNGPTGLPGGYIDVPPRSTRTIVGKGQVAWNGKPGDYRPYRLQMDVIFGVESQGQYLDLRNATLLLDSK